MCAYFRSSVRSLELLFALFQPVSYSLRFFRHVYTFSGCVHFFSTVCAFSALFRFFSPVCAFSGLLHFFSSVLFALFHACLSFFRPICPFPGMCTLFRLRFYFSQACLHFSGLFSLFQACLSFPGLFALFQACLRLFSHVSAFSGIIAFLVLLRFSRHVCAFPELFALSLACLRFFRPVWAGLFACLRFFRHCVLFQAFAPFQGSLRFPGLLAHVCAFSWPFLRLLTLFRIFCDFPGAESYQVRMRLIFF